MKAGKCRHGGHGGNEQVFFHPEKYDVAIYYPDIP